MSSQNDNKTKNDEWMKTVETVITELFRLSVSIIKENYYGFRDRTLPFKSIFAWQCFFFVFVMLKLDVWVAEKLHFTILYPYKYNFAYCVVGLMMGNVVYGILRHMRFKKFLTHITNCFRNAGLCTHAGKLPKYISNSALDNAVFEMRFYTNGIPMKKFIEAKDYLEASFFAIDDISPDFNNPHIVVIRYSSKSLPSIVEFSRTPTFTEGRFPIGLGRVGWIVTSFADVPHMLVGGGTGKGKSSFLRFIITYFLTRMRDVEVWHVDLKDGAEAAVFENVKNYRGTFEVATALRFLNELQFAIRDRMQFLAENKLFSIEDFYQKDSSKVIWSKAVQSRHDMKRIVLVIDEASSLFMAGPRNASADSIKARTLAQIIGAKGRAAGIHLVIATQRPDLRSVDTNLKTHLTGRLAFRMADIASSTTILDSARATKVSSVSGRAIWKELGLYTEIQLPFISATDTRQALESAGLVLENSSKPIEEKQVPTLEDSPVEFDKSSGFDLDERKTELTPVSWEDSNG
jgi:hypothetical protein